VPAAAVIPAPIAYIKVAAVKKLVVGFWDGSDFSVRRKALLSGAVLLSEDLAYSSLSVSGIQDFYFEKIRVFKAGLDAWISQHGIIKEDFGLILLVSRTEVMINRDSWGGSYLIVRGEILGFMKDELLRKHSTRMFSLIKNES
jgi:hypothetical protein